MSKFYVCSHCGNVIEKVKDVGVPVVCCGVPMDELTPNSVEASAEKHVPAVSVENGVVKVSVGSIDHPMAPEHYIEWVSLKTKQGVQRKALNPGDAPVVTFHLGEDEAVAVYAYCNLHGLWVKEL